MVVSSKEFRELMHHGIGEYLNNVHIFKNVILYISEFETGDR